MQLPTSNFIYSPNKMSFVPVKISLFGLGDKELSHATGFLFKHSNQTYLITNWHVVTGKNYQTGENLAGKDDIPTDISITISLTRSNPSVKHQFLIDGDGASNLGKISLYGGTGEYIDRTPIWKEHPKGREVDIVAIPFPFSLRCSCGKQHNYYHAEHEALSLNSHLKPKVSMDTFILGYPGVSISGGLSNFPIWKKATIASEPSFPIGDLPIVYLDTASRPGMSGSPVYLASEPVFRNPDGRQMIGRVFNFFGIYSGRLFARDRFDAQLGIMWHRSAIIEALGNKSVSPNPML